MCFLLELNAAFWVIMCDYWALVSTEHLFRACQMKTFEETLLGRSFRAEHFQTTGHDNYLFIPLLFTLNKTFFKVPPVCKDLLSWPCWLLFIVAFKVSKALLNLTGKCRINTEKYSNLCNHYPLSPASEITSQRESVLFALTVSPVTVASRIRA